MSEIIYLDGRVLGDFGSNRKECMESRCFPSVLPCWSEIGKRE